jgi:hypothetical protein
MFLADLMAFKVRFESVMGPPCSSFLFSGGDFEVYFVFVLCLVCPMLPK